MKCRAVFLLLSSLALLSCSKAERFVIGVSQCSEDAWREAVNNEILQTASFYTDLDVIIKSVRDDSKAQIADIESLIASRVDLLVVSPNESSALTGVVTKAYDAGIPVILFDRKTDNDHYTAYVGGDNFQIGQMAAEYVAAKMGGGV